MTFASDAAFAYYLANLDKLTPTQLAKIDRDDNRVSLTEKMSAEFSAIIERQPKTAKSVTAPSEKPPRYYNLVNDPVLAHVLNSKAEFKAGNRIVRITPWYTFSFEENDSSRITTLDTLLLSRLAAQNANKFFDIPGTSIKAFKIYRMMKPIEAGTGKNNTVNEWEWWGFNYYASTTQNQCSCEPCGGCGSCSGQNLTEGMLYNENYGYRSNIGLVTKNWKHVCSGWYGCWWMLQEPDAIYAKWNGSVNVPYWTNPTFQSLPGQWTYSAPTPRSGEVRVEYVPGETRPAELHVSIAQITSFYPETYPTYHMLLGWMETWHGSTAGGWFAGYCGNQGPAYIYYFNR